MCPRLPYSLEKKKKSYIWTPMNFRQTVHPFAWFPPLAPAVICHALLLFLLQETSKLLKAQDTVSSRLFLPVYSLSKGDLILSNGFKNTL